MLPSADEGPAFPARSVKSTCVTDSSFVVFFLRPGIPEGDQQFLCHQTLRSASARLLTQSPCAARETMEMLLTRISIAQESVSLCCCSIILPSFLKFHLRFLTGSGISIAQLRSGTRRQLPPRSSSFTLFETQINVLSNCVIGELRVKIVAIRYQILWLKCTKFDFGWGSAPDPARAAYGAPPDSLAEYKGPTSLPTCLPLTHVALCQRVRGVIARTSYINVLTCLLTSIVL